MTKRSRTQPNLVPIYYAKLAIASDGCCHVDSLATWSHATMLPLLLFALPAALAAPAARGPLTDSQARSLASAVIQARSTGVDVRSLLGSIFGGSDYNTDSDTYAPYTVSCPESITWIRNATELSQAEQQYLQDRATLVNSTWSSRLSELGLSSPRTPNVGVALSGGGYRAMISGSGAGFLQNDTQGSVGDILALSNYAAGLSGGSWALTSFYANDGQSPEYLVNNVSRRSLRRLIKLTCPCLRCGISTRTSSYPPTMHSHSTTTSSPTSPRNVKTRRSRRKSPTIGRWR